MTDKDGLYKHLLIVNEYRQCGYNGTLRQLSLSLLMALLVHMLLIRFSAPLEKHDVPLPHRASLLTVELVMSAMANESIDKKTVSNLPAEPKQIRPKAVSVSKPESTKPEPEITPNPGQRSKKKPMPDKNTPIQPHHVQHADPVMETVSSAVNIAVKNTKSRADLIATQAKKRQLRHHYLARIMRMIQAHKQYPYSARRRHIEGDIQISFSINASGYPDNIQISGKHAVLRKSTRSAIVASLPFPPPPANLSDSTRISFSMRYRLIN